MQSDANLRPLFDPDSVAVIGASRKPGKLGHIVLSNLVGAGYRGKLFPVNPEGGEILGLRVYQSISQLPHPPDLAVILLPRKDVLRGSRMTARSGGWGSWEMDW